MKYLQLFSIMFLAGIWVSVCWNWYVCQLQDICESGYSVRSEVNQEEIESLTTLESQTLQSEIAEEKNLSDSGALSGSAALDSASAPSLAQDDVLMLTEYNLRQPEEALETEDESESLTGEENQEVSGESIASICSVPLVGPIGLGDDNDAGEVMRLEAFLNTQGESLSVNGVYESADVAAVNRFQIAYRAQILDPWGIASPTGYVYRTTVQTMNEVACGKTYEDSASSDSDVGESEEVSETESSETGRADFDSLISDEA